MTTPRGNFPLISQGQTAQYDTHNQAIEEISILLQSLGGVLDWKINDPPVSPLEGDYYLIGDTPTGAWSTFAEHDLVFYLNGAWQNKTPVTGWRLFLESLQISIRFNGTLWEYNPELKVIDNSPTLPYTLVVGDRGKELLISGTGLINIPTAIATFPDGWHCSITLNGIGDLTMTSTGGTLRLKGGATNTHLSTENGKIEIKVYNPTDTENLWFISGDLTPT